MPSQDDSLENRPQCPVWKANVLLADPGAVLRLIFAEFKLLMSHCLPSKLVFSWIHRLIRVVFASTKDGGLKFEF
jgi:hypothetical protein